VLLWRNDSFDFPASLWKKLSVNEKSETRKTPPQEMLAVVKQIKKAVKILRTKRVVDDLIRRGIAPNRIERTHCTPKTGKA